MEKINLIQKKPQPFVDPTALFLTVVVIITTALFVAYGAYLDGNVHRTEVAVHHQDVLLSDLKGRLPDVDRLRGENARLGQQIATINGLRRDPVRYANLLREVSAIIPENCWLNQVHIDPNSRTMTLSGVSSNFGGSPPLQRIAQVMRNLQGSRLFVDSTLTSTSAMRSGDVSGWAFTIDAHYDDRVALGPL